MTVWCRQTWFKTLPREYLVSGVLTVSSMASLMAMPRLPGHFGSSARSLRPYSVWSLGLAWTVRAPGVHEHPAIGFLVVADPDHVDIALQAEQAARERQRGAPLARAGLGGQPFGAGDLVVIGLGDGGVDLMAAGGAGAFVFVINMRRGIQDPLQSHGAQQRRGPPERIDVAHRVGDFNPLFAAEFLLDEVARKNRLQRFRRQRLFGARMQRRRQRFGKVGVEIIPGGGNIGLFQIESGFLVHKNMGLMNYRSGKD